MTDKALLKKANELIEYTPHQLHELKKCSDDPIYFIQTYMKIQHPTKGSIHFVPYPYQIKAVENFTIHKDNILLQARQSGKTQIVAGYLLWFAAFHFDKTIMIVSNKNTSAMEIIHRIKYGYEELPMWLKPGVTSDGWSKHAVAFDNGSRIMSGATSPDSGRTYSISLLFCDEFAFVREGIQEEFWTAISPTLSTGGQCIIASTPNGDSNLYANLWRGAMSGVNGFHPMNVTWEDVPTRNQEWADREKAKIGERKFRQEHETEFLSDDPLLVDTMFLAQLKMEDPNFVNKEFKFFEDIEKRTAYIIGVDPATGTGSDFSTIEVFKFPEMRQVAEFRSNSMSSPMLYKAIQSIINFIDAKGNDIYWSCESNGVGEGIIALHENDENPNKNAMFISQKGGKRLGFTTTNKSKMKSCIDFKDLIESNTMIIKSKILLEEMKNFVRKGSSYQAKSGSTDDCISGCLIVTRILTEISEYEEEAHDILYNHNMEDEWFNSNGEDYYNDNDPDHAPSGIVF